MSELDQFLALTGRPAFQHIDDLVDALDDAGFWAEDWMRTVGRRAKKAKIRSLIRQAKDEAGWPLWASIVVQPPDGTPYRVYQQELFMDLEDYLQVVHYWIGYAQRGMTMASGYRDRMVKRGGEQLSLPWE